ncbi:type II toxin-antitoxin system PemK/MazF family toxin [Okeania sp.]|uniref:type II toxin-antitoxin system PemK/MazF family toxin n=1 Tax=Okeania sp. TaxID=3100323 RepID=UPI002B4AAE84|nr:type II toxin-antitoxin system PemK/MazF family toxin [Okeania sp.]MEB3341272.1 type II toxin-antitoxin system PemK/MazF family toxin [Okeania sp.]
MVNFIRGDMVLCDLNPVVGTEQAGIRPVVIVQIDRANAVSPHTIIAPFTSKINRALLPSHVLVPAGVGGLSLNSVILCEQLRVIDKSRIMKKIGSSRRSLSRRISKSVEYNIGFVPKIA